MKPDPTLYNEDLAPIPWDQRQWGWVNMATIWMGMVHNIVVYEAAAGLMAIGLSAIECLEVVAVAYTILFVTMWFNAQAGTRYGIPFCVLIRTSFGPSGAQLPVLLRGFCAIFWFSVQAYTATQAIDAILETLWPYWSSFSTSFLGMSFHRWGALLFVWLLHGWIINHGIERIGNFELIAGPLVILVGACATGWALHVGHGLGPLFSTPSRLHGWTFVMTFTGGVTGMIGMWASFAVNIPDLSRFVRSQRDQAIGQAVGLPLTALVFTPMAIITTSATVLLFGHALWNPIDLLLALNHPVLTIAGGAIILLATLSVNVVANIMPACYDLINILPRILNFHRSSYLVLILGTAFMPWLWFSEAQSIFHILDIVSGLLGPVTGIMLADYFILRKERLFLPDLYNRTGRYRGYNGWGIPAVISFVVGGICAVIGSIIPLFSGLNQISWFVGLCVGGILYLALTWRQRDLHIDSMESDTDL